MLATYRRIAAVLISLALTVAAGSARAQDEALFALQAEIDVLDGMFPAFAWFPWTEEEDETAFLYGDTKGIVHHYVSDGGRLREKWKSFPL
ncbi:MAG TPA: hypothetical protein VKU85_04290, partial [bacterium]|nr:hypothetical protein [bacterium]